MASILTPAARGPNSPENTIRGKHSQIPITCFTVRLQPPRISHAAACRGRGGAPVLSCDGWGGVPLAQRHRGAAAARPSHPPLPRPGFR